MAKHWAEGSNKVELNMTSMIDVVFLLLIFFLVTLNIKPEEKNMIETDMAKSAPRPSTDQVDTTPGGIDFDDIELSLSVEAGKVVRRLDSLLMPSDNSMRARLTLLKQYNEHARMCIRCGEDVPYADLIWTISLAEQTGVNVAFADLKRE